MNEYQKQIKLNNHVFKKFIMIIIAMGSALILLEAWPIIMFMIQHDNFNAYVLTKLSKPMTIYTTLIILTLFVISASVYYLHDVCATRNHAYVIKDLQTRLKMTNTTIKQLQKIINDDEAQLITTKTKLQNADLTPEQIKAYHKTNRYLNQHLENTKKQLINTMFQKDKVNSKLKHKLASSID